MKRFLSWLTLCLAMAVPILAQDAADKDTDNSVARLPIPSRMSDGRAIIATGVYQSQVVGIVPKDYQPISSKRLSAAIQAQGENADRIEDTLLKSSFYDIRLVDNLLVSDRSSIDLEFSDAKSTTVPLGRVNIALTNEPDPAFWLISDADFGQQARLESAADGVLYANVPRSEKSTNGATLDFAWELRGKQDGIYQSFVLQIPRTVQTRIVLSTPADLIPETDDGVLRSLPGPPPEADIDSRRDDVCWHTIDAGGLSEVKIRFRPMIDEDRSTPTLVRSQVLQYDIGQSGLDWIHTLTIQAPGGRTIPELHVTKASVTSVAIDGVRVRFDQVGREKGVSSISIRPSLGGPASHIKTSVISISGTASPEAQDGWADLPFVTWNDKNVIVSHHSTEAQLQVRDPFFLVAWNLPAEWTQQKARTPPENSALTQIVASGPPIIANPIAQDATEDQATDAEKSKSSQTTLWSQVRLTRRPSMTAKGILAQFRIDGNSSEGTRLVTAKAQLELSVDANRNSPIEVQLEPFWNLSNVTFTHSGRVIEASSMRQRGRVVTLWPEQDDLSDSVLTIQCDGYRRVPVVDQSLTLPEMWFVRLNNIQAASTMAIVPPDNLNWTGAVALNEVRLTANTLSDADLRFFDGITDDTLIYRPRTDATPELWLEKPSVLIDVHTSLQLQLVDDKVHESLIIDAQTNSQLFKQLSIRMLAQKVKQQTQLPNYRWSLVSKDSGVPINLPSTAINIDQPGQSTIDLGETSLRGRQLMGRREYSLDAVLRIELPNVIGTASQESEVILGQGLHLDRLEKTVQRVPLMARETANDTSSDNTSAPQASAQQASEVRLRYDAAKNPWIEFSKRPANPNMSIVWQQDIELTASSRGADSIRGTFSVSADSEIRIDYEPDLQLVSLMQNGISVDLATVPERPILLHAQRQTDTIRAVWSRESVQRGWWRQCRIPDIHMQGAQINPTYRLKESSDTFALASLHTVDFDSQSPDINDSGIEVTALSYRSLVHLDHAIAAGWLFSIILFAVSWAFARRRILTLTALIAIATVSAILWWPWQAAIIGWIVLPMVAAGLLETTRKWNKNIAWTARHNDESPRKEDSTEFSLFQAVPGTPPRSLGKPLGLILGWTLLFLTSQNSTHAQQPRAKSGLSNDIHVLVPIDKESQPIGDKVYISSGLYQELIDDGQHSTPNEVTFLSANYQVDLAPISDTEQNESNATVITAQFAIRVRGESNLARLPFATHSLRRIEIREGEKDRIVRFSANESDSVLAALPQGKQFLLNVSFIPEDKRSGNEVLLQLPIPSISASQATIESDRSIASVQVPDALGDVVEDRALRRWIANLGPIDLLQIRYSAASEDDQDSMTKISRRFLVRVGKSMTHIDCQVDLSRNIPAGDEIQLYVADRNVPAITSAAWRLVTSEPISPTRQRLRIRKLTDENLPIQLLWSRQSTINDATSLEDRQAMKLPDVSTALATSTDPAWIAVDHAPELSVNFIDEGVSTGLTAEKFYTEWNGYRDKQSPSQAIVTDGAIPAIVVLQSRVAETTATVSQHLYLQSHQALIDYRANIKSGDSLVQQRSLRVPRNIQITRLTIDGNPIEQTAKTYRNYFEYPLGEFAGTDDVLIEAVGSMRIPKSQLFTVPQVRLWPATTSDDQYVVTREKNVIASVVRPPEQAVDVEVTTVEQAQLLRSGQIVVANWKLEQQEEKANWLVGRLQVAAQDMDFDCQQFIKMNYLDGRWGMSTEITFDRGSIPDFIDLEIPTRWCDQLDVSPKTHWTQAVSVNPSFQLVRIACDRDALSKQKLTVRSELYANDLGRVSVPQIKVLGIGQRRVEFSLPNRLTTEPIQWETRAVSPIKEIAGRSTFMAEQGNWSLELAPMSVVESDPIALAVDSRIFPQAKSVIVVTRWDIVPNGLDAVVVDLPDEAKCLGVWSAGDPVSFERLVSADDVGPTAITLQTGAESNHRDPQSTNRSSIRIPLALSRLAQSIEILIEVPIADARQGKYLPVLQNVAQPNHWTAIFAHSTEATPNSSQAVSMSENTFQDDAQTFQVRSLVLAHSVVDAIDQSLDTLAERPTDEVATWLLPWIARYRDISNGAISNRPISNRDISNSSKQVATTQPVTDMNDDRLREIMTSITKRIVSNDLNFDNQSLRQAWAALDQKMNAHARRFLNADGLSQVIAKAPLFDANNFAGFQLAGVKRTGFTTSPPSIQPTSRGINTLRRVMTNFLTLAMMGGLLLLLRPLRQTIQTVCRHPATWLAIVGVIGILVAPRSVSLALIFVAATLAFIPHRKTQ